MEKPYNNYELPYPKEEQEALAKLNALMNEWCDAIPEEYYDFVPDGFYPYYYSQHPRVLFIGRESYGFCSAEPKRGARYLEWFYEECHNGNVKRFPLPRRIFYITHAILHGDAKSLDEVDVTGLAENFATKGHLSFAFMNLNKDSNRGEKEEGEKAPGTRWEELRAFVDTYHEQIRREIEILDPELIITANLFDKLPTAIADVFPGYKYVQHFGKDLNDLAVHEWENSGHRVYIFDTFHWSATKGEYQCYYACVRDAYRKYFSGEK